MIKELPKLFILFVFLTTGFSASEFMPETVDPLLEDGRWQSYPELNGKGCRCMVEEKNGALWFGINGGVMRYDGLEWKTFRINSDTTDTPVTVLCAASDGTIYADDHSQTKKMDLMK
jgi:hypothetical protein